VIQALTHGLEHDALEFTRGAVQPASPNGCLLKPCASRTSGPETPILVQLQGQLDWPAIVATDFRSADVKERKQADFLVYERFPWELVVRIDVRSLDIQEQAAVALQGAAHRPAVEIRRDWYY